jgi:hypothetical protein
MAWIDEGAFYPIRLSVTRDGHKYTAYTAYPGRLVDPLGAADTLAGAQSLCRYHRDALAEGRIA